MSISTIDDPIDAPEERRAWAEIDLTALADNYSYLRSQMPGGCELMAVVKSDAYGHGVGPVAARLQEEGAGSFAVATVGEGVRLRKYGIDGEIIVLGYTDQKDASLLGNYRLTQLIFDGAHANALDKTGVPIRAHIAIDTGMHREGIVMSNISEIESVFKCGNLTIEGMGTHLSSADSIDTDEIDFCNTQIDRFYETVETLRDNGYDTGKLHIQASYGLLRYPELRCDYIRAGILLYGVMSYGDNAELGDALTPVLSLRAVIAQVRWIDAGESVSYGRTFTAGKPMKLATICIGYADGVPRQMSGDNAECIIRGRKAPIVGRICMDLLMADVTEIDSAAQGDVATLIGSDGSETIRCEDFAKASGTITNEILCRMGSRLPRIYK